MTRQIATLFVFCAAFAVAPLASSAAPITVPTDLSVGDKYRLAFVTSTTRDATDTDITLYNAFVDGVANTVPELAALGTTWTAIGSTSSIDARDNTLTNPNVSVGDPIYRLDNTRIANDNADLWDGIIIVPLLIGEQGLPVSHPTDAVWTGTEITGIAQGLSEFGAASGVTNGFYPKEGPFWMEADIELFDTPLPLYAMSGPLTVILEPSSIALAAFGFLALAAWGWRRKR